MDSSSNLAEIVFETLTKSVIKDNLNWVMKDKVIFILILNV